MILTVNYILKKLVEFFYTSQNSQHSENVRVYLVQSPTQYNPVQLKKAQGKYLRKLICLIILPTRQQPYYREDKFEIIADIKTEIDIVFQNVYLVIPKTFLQQVLQARTHDMLHISTKRSRRLSGINKNKQVDKNKNIRLQINPKNFRLNYVHHKVQNIQSLEFLQLVQLLKLYTVFSIPHLIDPNVVQ
eukprot:TRINITY_DN2374_c0_g1_i8.p2 TRINITY_DN2374_c0_g1~~TRINITY_DN2374_c0_g1_i8.p2  ORF type:complete len:189 (+),score=-8.97 TRINITY_DN2374_c0_g1_i8:672-1238(+)